MLSEAYAYVHARRIRASVTTEDPLDDVRRELDALVSTFETHVIVNPELTTFAQEASAFVAAEAAYLLAQLSEGDEGTQSESVLWPARHHHAARAGLLYLLSHHYPNARQTADRLLGETPQVAPGVNSSHARRLFLTLRAYLHLQAPSDVPVLTPTVDGEPIADRVRGRAAQVLATALEAHARWLSAERVDLPDAETEALQRIVTGLIASGRYPWIVGLSRLSSLVMERLTPRALREQSWNADSDLHRDYLASRCPSRPVVWPSGLELAEHCFPGMNSNAVVSIPTGSGKGFLAETAIAQVLDDGWVVYLVPTNALANQVRRELARSFAFSEAVHVQAFLGGQEYSLLPTETIEQVRAGTIVVMTPEKCAAALRRSESAFENLRLLIFDECHLLSESGGRGSLGELVVAHIASVATNLSALFTSALLENPDELGEWLSAITGRNSHVVSNAWRPTRTMRGVIGVHRRKVDKRADEAVKELESLPERRKNVRFNSPYRAVVSLQGAWTSSRKADYALLDPRLEADLKVTRTNARGSWSYSVDADSWVNRSASAWSSFLARTGERVLTFLPRSRHDPFSVGGSVNLARTNAEQAPSDSPTAAHLLCAEYELGTTSELGSLLARGVAVHSSSLIDEERHAAESAFRSGEAAVMLATGTLAQGLNLPATAVIVGGTRIGSGRRQDGQADEDRVRAQLLNAVGRAGRAEFANHGIALVIPTNPIAIGSRSEGRRQGAESAPFLRFEDASVAVGSALLPFMTSIRDDELVIDAIEALTVEEMTAFTYAPRGGDGDDAPRVFARTLAAWTLEEAVSAELGVAAASTVSRLGQTYFERAGVPDWVRDVAAQVGMPLPTLFHLYGAAARRPTDRDDTSTIDGWLRRLIQLLSQVEPRMSATMLFGEQLLGGTIREPSGWTFAPLAIDGSPASARREAWRQLYRTLRAYLAGASLAQVAAVGLGLEVDEVIEDHGRASGSKPLPRAIRMTSDLCERLSLIAGGVLAIHHIGMSESDTDQWALEDRDLRALSYLPHAVRSGCGDLSSLSWFRFGIRYRRPAHLLARRFPVPDDLSDDEAVRAWVRTTRQQVLDDIVGMTIDTEEDERTVLAAVAQIITDR